MTEGLRAGPGPAPLCAGWAEDRHAAPSDTQDDQVRGSTACGQTRWIVPHGARCGLGFESVSMRKRRPCRVERRSNGITATRTGQPCRASVCAVGITAVGAAAQAGAVLRSTRFVARGRRGWPIAIHLADDPERRRGREQQREHQSGAANDHNAPSIHMACRAPRTERACEARLWFRAAEPESFPTREPRSVDCARSSRPNSRWRLRVSY
jgi:hypothetical protein